MVDPDVPGTRAGAAVVGAGAEAGGAADAEAGADVDSHVDARLAADTDVGLDTAAGAAGPVDREVLLGGVNEVVREGDTVRRPAGPWSATVQRLLAHLNASGFDGAPAPLGLSDDGREELVEFLPGEVGHDFAAPQVRSDASLVAVAKLLRRLHDASATFVRSDADVWYMPPRDPAEVICHGDAATYNTVFRDNLPVAFIDFDTAHPAPRVWDAAYTAYRFVPLYAPDEAELTQPIAEARRRLALFADAYGLTDAERAALPTVAAERLRAHVALMRSEAAAGNAAFARHIAEGHDRRYLTDAEWIARVYGGELRSERLVLRPVRPDVDQAWLLAHWTELDVRRFLHDGELLTPGEIATEIEQSMRTFAEGGYGLWLVELADSGTDGDVDGSSDTSPAADADTADDAGTRSGASTAADTGGDAGVPATPEADADLDVVAGAGANASVATADDDSNARPSSASHHGDVAEPDADPATDVHAASDARPTTRRGASTDAESRDPHRRTTIGTVGIRPLEDLGLELYYSLAPDAWGRGYATEAARLVRDHALGTLGLPELLAEVDADNSASAAIIAKLGMEPFDVVPGVLGPMTRYRTVSSPTATD